MKKVLFLFLMILSSSSYAQQCTEYYLEPQNSQVPLPETITSFSKSGLLSKWTSHTDPFYNNPNKRAINIVPKVSLNRWDYDIQSRADENNPWYTSSSSVSTSFLTRTVEHETCTDPDPDPVVDCSTRSTNPFLTTLVDIQVAPDSICINSCQAEFGSLTGGEEYNRGMFRRTSEGTGKFRGYFHYTTQSCSGNEDFTNDDGANPISPENTIGFVFDQPAPPIRVDNTKKLCGTVNGVQKCYPLVENAVTGRDMTATISSNEDSAFNGEFATFDLTENAPVGQLYYEIDGSSYIIDITGDDGEIPAGVTVNKGSGDSDSTYSNTQGNTTTIANETNHTGGFSTTNINNNSSVDIDTSGLAQESTLQSVESNLGTANNQRDILGNKLSDIVAAIQNKETGALTVAQSNTLTGIQANTGSLVGQGQAAGTQRGNIISGLGAVKDAINNIDISGSPVQVNTGHLNKEATQVQIKGFLSDIKDTMTEEHTAKDTKGLAEPTADLQARSDAAKQELKDLVTNVRASMGGYISTLGNQSGALPKWDINTGNYAFSIDFTQHPEYLTYTASIIMFIGYFFAFIILISKY